MRTCVAPAATAASRSPLIPAEIQAASGWAARTCAAVSASRAEVREPYDIGGPGTAAARGPAAVNWVEGHLDEYVERRHARPVERGHQLGPVDRMHDVRERRDQRGLVPLQRADEVPARRRPGVGVLRRCFLRPVLPHVGDAELGEQPYVGRRERLRHGDQGELVRRAPGGAGRRGHPLAHRGEVRGQLGAARLPRVGHGDSMATMANRPVTPSRRYE
jgi:hypothetical protein